MRSRFGIERRPYTKSRIDQIPEPICIKIIPANTASYADCYRLLRFEIFTPTIFKNPRKLFLEPHNVKPMGNRGLL